jgi:hypothetical protein
VIAVSRLCCPVCWETFQIIGQDDKFALRGRHSSLYSPQLPPWLPDDVLDALIDRFTGFARKEVADMVHKVSSSSNDLGHNRSPSDESVSADKTPEIPLRPELYWGGKTFLKENMYFHSVPQVANNAAAHDYNDGEIARTNDSGRGTEGDTKANTTTMRWGQQDDNNTEGRDKDDNNRQLTTPSTTATSDFSQDGLGLLLLRVDQPGWRSEQDDVLERQV